MKTVNTKKLVLTAALLALVLLFGLTPLGLIPLGFINVTLLCLPVIIGAIYAGPGVGLILGLCFGLTSVLSAFGVSMVPQSALAGALVAKSPLLAVVMSMVPRALVPLAASLVYRAVGKGARSVKAVLPAAVAGSLVNTLFYLGLMLLFYVLTGLDAAAVLGVIGGTGLIAGGAEAVVAALVCTPVLADLFQLDHNRKESANHDHGD